MRRLLISVVAILVLFSLTRSVARADYQALVDSAIGYLETSQNPDGSWGDRSAFRDTVTVVAALQESRPHSQAIARATAWLSTQVPANDDLRARRTTLLARLGFDVSVDRGDLAAKIRDDRGWGISKEYESDVLTTSQIILALQDSPLLTYEAKSAVLEWILSLQREAGGFGYTGANESSIFLTSELIRALSKATPDANLTQAINRAGTFLLAQLGPDGSLGDTL